jgi:hypothetical protein
VGLSTLPPLSAPGLRSLLWALAQALGCGPGLHPLLARACLPTATAPRPSLHVELALVAAQGRVTDHRVGVTEHGLEGVLSGERLPVFIDALQLHHQSQLLASLGGQGAAA